MKKKEKIKHVQSTIFALLCAACLLMIGCEQKEPQSNSTKTTEEEQQEDPKPTMYCSPQEIKAPFAGGEYSILLTAPSAWTASCNCDWVYIVSKSGQGTSYVNIKVDYGILDSANILFSSGTETTILKIVRGKELAETGKHNNHGYVDLGLSVKWATCNIGANSFEYYGNYYAWGETSTKNNYTDQTYAFYGGERKGTVGYYSIYTKYCDDSYFGTVDNKKELEPKDDAAQVNWGGNWRMPTSQESEELKTKCIWIRTIYKGIEGCLVCSQKKGYDDAIFIPFAGYYKGTSANYVGEPLITNWTASRSDNCTGSTLSGGNADRAQGRPIRAVFK